MNSVLDIITSVIGVVGLTVGVAVVVYAISRAVRSSASTPGKARDEDTSTDPNVIYTPISPDAPFSARTSRARALSIATNDPHNMNSGTGAL